MNKHNEPIDLRYREILHETPKAYLVGFALDKEVWCSKDLEDGLDQGSKTITMPQWWVEQEELDEYAV